MPSWIIDGNNVYGSRPDGWWRDRRAAARRLTDQVVAWQARTGVRVTLVFDGTGPEVGRDDAEPCTHAVIGVTGGESGHEGGRGGDVGVGVEVLHATRIGRDAADDRIVALVEDRYADQPDLVVVTADRGLVDRLPPGVGVERPRRFLDRLAT